MDVRQALHHLAYVVAAIVGKGGVGKSTVNLNMGESLADRGYRVCLVDDEGQQSLTTLYGIEADGERTLYHVLQDGMDIRETLVSLGDNLDLVPGHSGLWDMSYTDMGDRALRVALEPLRQMYDFIIIDPSPALGPMTTMAVRASDGLLIVLEPGTMSVHGVQRFYDLLGRVVARAQKEGGDVPLPEILGILFNNFRAREIVHEQLLAELKARGLPVFPFTVRHAAAIQQAQLYGGSKGRGIGRYDPTHPVNDDLNLLIGYIERKAGYVNKK